MMGVMTTFVIDVAPWLVLGYVIKLIYQAIVPPPKAGPRR